MQVHNTWKHMETMITLYTEYWLCQNLEPKKYRCNTTDHARTTAQHVCSKMVMKIKTIL